MSPICPRQLDEIDLSAIIGSFFVAFHETSGHKVPEDCHCCCRRTGQNVKFRVVLQVGRVFVILTIFHFASMA